MLANNDRHAALVATMVLISVAGGKMTDVEIATMTRLIGSLPAFTDFDRGRITEIGDRCAKLLEQEDGLDVALGQIAKALPAPLRETAYALACDVIAADGKAGQNELRMLDLMREKLEVDRLVSGAIERAAQARHRSI